MPLPSNCQNKPLRVGFILREHFSLLAFTAAADALTTANLVSSSKHFEFQVLSIEKPDTLSDLGITIPCHHQFNLPMNKPSLRLKQLAAFDYLIVCGGHRCDLSESLQLTKLLQLANQSHVSLGGLWNGIVAVAQANLMTGYGCTLHPDSVEYLAAQRPELEIRSDTFVIDRNRCSAAGPNSAFDLMLMLIQRHLGASIVLQIRNILKADTQPNDSAEIALQRDQEIHYPVNLQRALQLMRNNLDDPVSKHDLSQHINLSIRAMERLFYKHLGQSPAKHYLNLRLTRANELLNQGSQSIGEVSDACGFISSAHFSRAFKKQFGNPPSLHRKAVKSMLTV